MASSRNTKVPNLRSSYKLHLLQKKSEMQNLFHEIAHDSKCPEIVPTPITKGCRNRAKFKIFGDPDGFAIKGTDPRQGEVPYENALWILPLWGKKLVERIIDVIIEKLCHFWVDGLEVQLSHGNRDGHVSLSVKRQDSRSYSELVETLLEKVPALAGVSPANQYLAYGVGIWRQAITEKVE